MRLHVEDVTPGLFSHEIYCNVVGIDRQEFCILRREDVDIVGNTVRCGVMRELPEGLLVEIPVATNEAARRFVVDKQLVIDAPLSSGGKAT